MYFLPALNNFMIWYDSCYIYSHNFANYIPLFQVYYKSENNVTIESIIVDGIKAEKEIPVSHLKSGTVYFLQIAAINQYGAGPKTNQIRVKTVYVPTTPGMQCYMNNMKIICNTKCVTTAGFEIRFGNFEVSLICNDKG